MMVSRGVNQSELRSWDFETHFVYVSRKALLIALHNIHASLIYTSSPGDLGQLACVPKSLTRWLTTSIED